MIRPTIRGAVDATLSLLVVFAAMAVIPAAASAADGDPAAPVLPTTVTADGLPTWQVNGVVWDQEIVGNTVYVTGNFTKARPPGAAAGAASEINAGSLFAYDIRTGNPVSNFTHTLNGAGRAVTASVDGSRIYVGGEFTTVDGQTRSKIAAFTTADGRLVTSFAPSVSSRVNAIAVGATTVYAGGSFTNVGSATRNRLAAFNASNGALLPWSPAADSNVTAMVLTPDKSSLIVGGAFLNVSGTQASGLAALDASTGAPRPWAAGQYIRNGGSASGITSLRTDGTDIFGTGYAFGTGNFEGTFSAKPTGELNWVNDCHGDTYDVAPAGDVVYNVSHVHDCSWIRDFPESNPRSTNQQHLTAMTNYATTTNIGPDTYGWNYDGLPASKLLQWVPDLQVGTITGQNQAGWTISANSQYVAVGGEFPRVNGVAQQSLTRFAVRSVAPNKRGPVVATGSPAPSALALSPGTLRVSWPSGYDQDDSVLTYQVFRSGTAAPVYTTTMASSFWNHPTMGFRDTGLHAGSYRYTVRITDPSGNVRTLAQTPAVATTTDGGLSAYASSVLADQPTAYWRLGEGSGTAVSDYANFNDAVAGTGVSRGAAGAIVGDADGASTLSGSETGIVSSGAPIPTTPSFAVEAWFQTTSTSGGKIVGYGSNPTGNSSSYDRHVYMTDDGRVTFGLFSNAVRTVTSPKSYNDGAYHQVVAMLDATDGMSLWIDGKKVASDPGTRTGQDYSGYWRVGGDNLGGWPGSRRSNYFAGTVDDVSIYPTTLSKARIQKHFTDSGRVLAGPPAPTDAFGAAVVADDPLLFWRLGDAAGATTAADSSGNDVTGVITDGGVQFGGPSGVGGTIDGSADFDGRRGTLGSSAGYDNPRVYTQELWFRTTTTQGGKLIGFGRSQTGTSGSYDRHVYMEGSGQLTFGAYTGQLNTATSPASYNDGAWHHLVASQGLDGMKLYVDSSMVASNPETGSEGYYGFWRVGGDNTWNGSVYFAGQLDDVAVYDRVLSGADVSRHFVAGGGQLPNRAPTAAFTATSADLVASFDASGSSDPDGTIASYSWSWGDATPDGSGATAAHTYAEAGTYSVALTVTDNRGGTATTSQEVVVTPANQAPTAAFTATSADLVASFDASGSSDRDGMIASYSWSWGDGTPDGSGATASHTFAAAGSYLVALTVTDNRGGTATTSQEVVVTPANQAPTAAFTSTSVDLVASFDASGSSDRDGMIASYSWSWGDGTPDGSGATASHTFAAAGSYLVALTVTDNRGGIDTTNREVVVSVANQAPTAAFTATSADLVASFDASGSSDPDGMIASYSWSWGDATPDGSGATAVHTYAEAGTYLVALTVTDNRGGTATTNREVVVTPANQAPTAAFTSTSVDLVASFDASGSSDRDGMIASYSWSWGDGTPDGSGATASHTFAAAGSYLVALTVTDNRGGIDTTNREVVVSVANRAPVAAFTSTSVDLVASFDASGSSDPDGTIASYSWSWGDGTPDGSGATASHTFAAAGSYLVALTVTDNLGVTATVTRTVQVNAAAPAFLARDGFSRTVTNGWGAAESGAAWIRNGAGTLFGVKGGVGSISLASAGSGPSMTLGGLSSTSTDLTVGAGVDKLPTGATVFLQARPRQTSASDYYHADARVTPNGGVTLALVRKSGSADTTLTAVALPIIVAAQDRILIRVQAVGAGTTTIRAKAWKVGTTEPTGWQASATDGTASLQVAGTAGVGAYLGSSATNAPIAVQFDDVSIVPAG